MNKLVSDAARAMQAQRKRKVGGFNDPDVLAKAMAKSLETRKKNAQSKDRQGRQTVQPVDKD